MTCPQPSTLRAERIHRSFVPTTDFDLGRIRRAVGEILSAIGEDPSREGLMGTPDRVARAYRELFGGLLEDPSEHLNTTFTQDSEDLVMLRGIEFTSFCEHHLLPVRGRAAIAYLPADRRVVGLSKLARTVDGYARRPQLQERLTAQIAEAITSRLSPHGVTVLIEAEHSCLSLRGARNRSAVMRTVAHRGCFADDVAMRREVLALLGPLEAASQPVVLEAEVGVEPLPGAIVSTSCLGGA